MQQLIKILVLLRSHSAEISALTALVAVIISPLVTIYVSRKQMYATVVSQNRVKWVEDLRNDVVEYGLLFQDMYFTYFEKMRGESIVDDVIKMRLSEIGNEVDKIGWRIILRLNPDESDHLALIKLITGGTKVMDEMVDEGTKDSYRRYAQELMAISRGILRTEWKRASQLK